VVLVVAAVAVLTDFATRRRRTAQVSERSLRF
jgi:hypothetical protein